MLIQYNTKNIPITNKRLQHACYMYFVSTLIQQRENWNTIYLFLKSSKSVNQIPDLYTRTNNTATTKVPRTFISPMSSVTLTSKQIANIQSLFTDALHVALATQKAKPSVPKTSRRAVDTSQHHIFHCTATLPSGEKLKLDFSFPSLSNELTRATDTSSDVAPPKKKSPTGQALQCLHEPHAQNRPRLNNLS